MEVRFIFGNNIVVILAKGLSFERGLKKCLGIYPFNNIQRGSLNDIPSGKHMIRLTLKNRNRDTSICICI